MAGVALLALLVCATVLHQTPEKRVARYVAAHQTELDDAMEDYFLRGLPLSYPGEIVAVNDWPGQYPMVEYLLFTTATGRWGFYYSPEDVPLAFQNAAVALSESGDGWTWRGAGDDQGSTWPLAPCWYGFKASF